MVKGMEKMSNEEYLVTLDLSVLEGSSLRGDVIALYSFLRRERGKRGVDLFSLGFSDRTQENVQSCSRGD